MKLCSSWVDVDPALLAELQKYLERAEEKRERFTINAPDDTGLDISIYAKRPSDQYMAPLSNMDPKERIQATDRIYEIGGWFECEAYGKRGYGGSCMSKAKVEQTIRNFLRNGIAPPIAGEADPERESKLDAERVTLEFATRSRRPLDAGRAPIEESPLFGGPAQGTLF